MNVAKRKQRKRSAVIPPGLSNFGALMLGPGRPVLIAVLLAAATFAAWHFVWREVRDDVLSSESYLVMPQKVELTPLPDWIHTDVRNDVFRSAGLDGPLSIMDEDLAERIKNAFSLHPWVGKVERVQKLPQARVKVDLVYRRPVCMVEVPAGLLPVDVSGVLLPVDDFSPIEAERYPRLIGIDTIPLGTTGEGWSDARVVGGAEIAAAFGATWEELNLSHIVASPSGITGEYTYTLLTRGGTQIRWGLAPGNDAPGELPATEKVARLQRYVQQHGSLEDRNVPQELDVHKLHEPRVSSRPKS